MTAIIGSPVVVHALLHSIPDAIITFSVLFRRALSVGMIGQRIGAHSIIVVKTKGRIVLIAEVAVTVVHLSPEKPVVQGSVTHLEQTFEVDMLSRIPTRIPIHTRPVDEPQRIGLGVSSQ